MRYYCAPMEGVTGLHFRLAQHQFFGGVDKYVMPFFYPSQHHVFGRRDRLEVSPEQNEGLPVVPQVITKHAEDFLWAVGELADMGYREVNLNLGCPSGTVFAKGRGAGFLVFPDALDAFLEEVFTHATVPISIKTRLGVSHPDEFSRLLEIYNKYPICELTIHPRVREDFYKNHANRAVFATAMGESKNPLCYNGDLFTATHCKEIAQQFPTLDCVMVGRGLIADPGLIAKAKGGSAFSKATYEGFHDALFHRYTVAFGHEGSAMQRMKEYWFYHSHLFRNCNKHLKALRKSPNPQVFRSHVAAIFRDLELRDEVDVCW